MIKIAGNPHKLLRTPACILLFIGWFLAPLPAQETDPVDKTQEVVQPPETPQPSEDDSVTPDKVTPALIEELLKRYPAPTADQPASSEYNALLQAQKDLRSQTTWESKLKELHSAISKATELIDGVKADNAALDEAAPLEIPEDVASVEALLASLRGQRTQSLENLREANDNISSAPERRLQNVDRVNELESLIRELEGASSPSDAVAAANLARLQNYRAELEFTRLSLSSADVQRQYDAALREYENKRSAILEQRVEGVASTLKQLREAALRQQEAEARKAQRLAAMQDPALKELADTLQVLTAKRRELDELNATTQQSLNDYNQEAADIRELLGTLQRRLSISGRSPSVGALIQRQMLMLPDFGELEKMRNHISREIKTVQANLLELELTLGANPVQENPALRAIVEPPPERAGSFSILIAQETLDDLLEKRKTLLNDLIQDSNRYFESLVSIDTAIKSTSQSVEDFEKFAIVHSIWIPNRKIMEGREVVLLPGFLGEVTDNAAGLLVETVTDSLTRFLLAIGGTILALALVLWLNPKLNSMRASPLGDYRISATIVPLLFEVFLAATPILVFGWFAWALDSPGLENELAQPLKQTILRMGEPTIILILVYRLCLPRNLGPLQFRWPVEICRQVRLAFVRYLVPGYFIFFIGGVLYRMEIAKGEPAGSRIFYLLGVVCAILAINQIFSPQKGVLSRPQLIRVLNISWIKKAIHFCLIGWPTLLAILIILGYMVGVAAFFTRTVETLWALSLVAISGGVLVRYARGERLRSLRQWRIRRKEDQAARLAGVGTAWREIRDQGQDMARILGVGSFLFAFVFIWIDTFPAFYTFANTPLLTGSDDVVILSVGQLFQVIICLLLTFFLAVHLPRILQVFLFSRIRGFTQGNRYAVSTLMSYGVVIIGVVWASTIAGIKWESIQWLLAAATVGLGFGLQEIFGNLFAGIIVLFERPVRVGDVVTINNTTGIVSRIRIRATTIRQWDRTELIVPNKDIITQQLTNWSLSDAMTRITITVKVGFEAEPEQVIKVLKEAISSHPGVSRNPPPFVLLLAIEEYAFKFNCYAYLDNLETMLGMKGELHQVIVRVLRENKISIPYPKQSIEISGPGDPGIQSLKNSILDTQGSP